MCIKTVCALYLTSSAAEGYLPNQLVETSA